MATPRTAAELVAAAHAGDQRAWEEIVARYLPLVVTVVGRFRLSRRDAEDVSQTVWLRLVEHLGQLREPAALPRWIAQTAKHESIRLATAARRTMPVDPMDGAPGLDAVSTEPDIDHGVLQDERRHALRTALALLPADQRELLLLLVADPPLSYAEISARTGRPIGSIGPSRARCLRRLREMAPVQGLQIDGDPVDPARPARTVRTART